jgi:adenylate kinase
VNIILLGAPGAGKGTAASVLCQKLNLKHVSTGNIFRDEIARKTPVGLKVEDLISKGNLVSDEVVLEIVASALRGMEQGFLFDGFPRTLVQAKGLEDFLKQEGKRIDYVVLLDADEETIIKRISGRRTCGECGAVYNINTEMRSKTADACDKCNGKLVHRKDDTEESVRRRLEVYREQTAPLIEYYKDRKGFLRVNASGRSGDVISAVLDTIGTPAK